MIDVSCFAGEGPLMPPSVSAPENVETLLRQAGVTRAAVSPMAALFHPILDDGFGSLPAFFRPVPVVVPEWPDHRLASYRHRGFPAVRISPGSHGYHAAEAVELKRTCGDLGLTLILQMRVADPRNLPANLELPEVAVEDAAVLALAAPEAPMVVAGARAHELPAILGETPDSVLAEVSLAEEPDILRRAVITYGAHRLLIGTHAPFLTPFAAAQKLAAARLTADDHAAVSTGNAERLGF
jgi:hypothetical protein